MDAETRKRIERVVREMELTEDGDTAAVPAWIKILRAALAAEPAAPPYPPGAHAYAQRDGVEVCIACGMVRNRDRETLCRGGLPMVQTRPAPPAATGPAVRGDRRPDPRSMCDRPYHCECPRCRPPAATGEHAACDGWGCDGCNHTGRAPGGGR